MQQGSGVKKSHNTQNPLSPPGILVCNHSLNVGSKLSSEEKVSKCIPETKCIPFYRLLTKKCTSDKDGLTVIAHSFPFLEIQILIENLHVFQYTDGCRKYTGCRIYLANLPQYISY